MGLPPVASAASLTASLSVGCPWQVLAISSVDPLYTNKTLTRQSNCTYEN